MLHGSLHCSRRILCRKFRGYQRASSRPVDLAIGPSSYDIRPILGRALHYTRQIILPLRQLLKCDSRLPMRAGRSSARSRGISAQSPPSLRAVTDGRWSN